MICCFSFTKLIKKKFFVTLDNTTHIYKHIFFWAQIDKREKIFDV